MADGEENGTLNAEESALALHEHEQPVRSTSTPIPPNPDSHACQYASYGGTKLAAFVYDIISQTQTEMENMLLLINEIDAGSVEILEYVDRCKESSLERKSKLEEERERFQQTACRVLDMLGSAASNPLSIVAATPREEASPPLTTDM